ncbi:MULTISPECIES: thiamine pyrophosphate-dependent enzyme [unclassified Ruegeria]|uniref:thiamine pyrophosphate-dependent enzyme n=1 Tax=unclassified Ruegeria TaxID=2625375 RepID=UPI001489EB0E|nr:MULTISPECIES: thiamine pyrophosphate-dependent enzyme [unclassified Ruegeria]NOD76962.1 ubiquinone-dependent pyruvate dehydrogenase [Ruegeria sp. HKCCD4332]NOD88485.1 ubiquinone-dependent pyruvate dehydrogenase [Ruegeria sp. HKCCD4318]NOD94693.1 ubiquinone-dependent pyruvate dehydrogenase [Ruegeria sp. HKCCD4884]NOE13394.1 ubiquinone-dependent pyruvate dehydrogenase [Ruegeria sp. HKCCD4318-2]NOG11064.1 ubiquinone-dependent pyruvate dehydrogenase [Ruegeria sp. HKCCD4315]
MAKNVCEVLLDILADAGGRQIFGVVGDALNPFLEAMRGDDRFEWKGLRHEENAAYAAYAQSHLTGGIGICAGTVGPGALHLINGLYNAKREGAGVVAITGQVAHRERGTGYHQEVNLEKAFDDVCDYQAVIHTPDQMPRLAQIAVQRALINREVVRIELPIDVSEQKVPSLHQFHPLLKQPSTLIPPEDEIARAAQIINAGKKVALFAGVGCREAKDQVLALSQKLNAPLAHTLKGKDIFDYDDPNVVGMTGLIGNPGGYHAVRDCDVLVMLGTDFPYEWFLPETAKIVQIDRSVENLGRRAPIASGLLGDVGATLDRLLPQIAEKEDRNFADHQVKLCNKWLAQQDKEASLERASEPLHPQLFAREISNQAAEDAVFAMDIGECTVWVARQTRMKGGRRMVGSFNHSSLGSGLPSALGAAALDPSREVWTFCGDGGFGMSMQDFVTAVRYDWPIKVIVFNNQTLGFVKMEMEVAGYAVNPMATDLVNPDFAEYAKVCGGDGVRVEHAADIKDAIAQAKASTKPFIIDAMVTPGELVMPPHVDTKMAWGFGMSKLKEGILLAKGDHAQWDNWVKELKAQL